MAGLSGHTFTRLTVIKPAPCPDDIVNPDELRRAWWECKCECGTVAVKSSKGLISGRTRSCGCLKIEASQRTVAIAREHKRVLAEGGKLEPRAPRQRESKERVGSPWTPEILQELRDLWPCGHSTSEIGRRLGFSKNAIIGKARRIGLTSRPSPIIRDPSAPKPKPSVPRPVFTLPPLASSVVTVAPAPRPVIARPAIVRQQPRPAPEPPRTDASRECQFMSGHRHHWVPCGKPAIGSWCPEHSRKVHAKRRDREEAA